MRLRYHVFMFVAMGPGLAAYAQVGRASRPTPPRSRAAIVAELRAEAAALDTPRFSRLFADLLDPEWRKSKGLSPSRQQEAHVRQLDALTRAHRPALAARRPGRGR
jgi:hypothetical protein